MKIENIDVWPSLNQTGFAAVCFDLDGVACFEWLNTYDGFWVVERTDSNLKINLVGDYDLYEIYNELDTRLEELT